MCISQLDRFQLISGGVDEGVVPDIQKARGPLPNRVSSNPARKSLAPSRPRPPSSNSSYQLEIAQESKSPDVIKGVDRIFSSSAELSGDA